MDTVQSPCVSKLHPFHSFSSLRFSPFLFWLWSACLQVRLFGCLSELHHCITMKIKKKPHKTEQIKSPRSLNVMGIPGLELGKLGMCHGADPLLQLLSFGLSLPEAQPRIFLFYFKFEDDMVKSSWWGFACELRMLLVVKNARCSLLECDNSFGKTQNTEAKLRSL